MKSTGVVRKLDSLGRIVLPSELRHDLELPNGTPMEIFIREDQIILRKYQPGCHFCDSLTSLKTFSGKHVCSSCIQQMQEMSK